MEVNNIHFIVVSPKHQSALDLLPFQGFARRSGIQVFRLYSRPSSVTDGMNESQWQGRTRMWAGRNVYAACSDYVGFLALGESATRSLVRRPRGGRSAFY